MLKHQPTPRQMFFIVFCDRVTQHWNWWHLFMKPGFFHCFVLRKTIAGTLVFQPMFRTWILDWQPNDLENVVAQLLADDRYKVLAMDRPGDARYNRFGFIHCVSVVKACIGVKSSAITPYQLYRDLLQMGAVEVKL